MKQRRLIRLSPPFGGRIARAGLAVLLTAAVSVSAYAQTEDEGRTPDRADYNRELRTHTWSIYAQGGTSWVSGLWYQSQNAKASYALSPAVGGGVDFHIQPWVRVGAEYLYSRYRGEQRMSALNHSSIPVKAYGNYLMNYHNIKLGAGFNIMQLWPQRKPQWLNAYVGTGLGYMMASGNEHGIWFSSTLTQGGTTTPITGNTSVSNSSTLTITGNVKTVNEHSSFQKLYIPLSLHVEADVSRQFSVGLKGEFDWLLNRKTIAPENLIFALATVRYNFVPSRAKVLEARHQEEIEALNGRLNELRLLAEAEGARADRAAADNERMQAEQADLQARLDECAKSLDECRRPVHVVHFAHDVSLISRQERALLRAFAKKVQGQKLSLVAEASTPGTPEYNQGLSERRLQRVISALVAEGFAEEDLQPNTAIGSQNGIPTAEGRRVTITPVQ